MKEPNLFLFRNQLNQLRYFVLVDNVPLNSVQVSHPTFADLSAALDIDGPRGKYMLFENVMQPVWRRKDAIFLYIDSDSVPATYNEQFQMALQRVWNGIDSSKILHERILRFTRHHST